MTLGRKGDSATNLPHPQGNFLPREDEGPGVVFSAAPESSAVLSDLRAAIVADLNNPGSGTFTRRSASLRTRYPDLVTYGRCTYPHPDPRQHGHEFPYADGVDCLVSEVQDTLDRIEKLAM